jgi:hypothetical protein
MITLHGSADSAYTPGMDTTLFHRAEAIRARLLQLRDSL